MMKSISKKYEGGAVMLTVVIVFLFITMVIILGVTVPILKEAGMAADNLSSMQSYYSAEAALEDVYGRLQMNKTVGASETMSINGGTVSLTSTDNFTGKLVVATGNVNGDIRKVQASFVKGTGIVFKYGTQSGQGGFIFDNNSVLVGTLYSNGDILGSNGAYITGDAYAAGSAGRIDNVDVGVGGTGSAHAYQVTNLNVTGALYCKVGSNNNKACNTTEALPEALPLPISDADIDGWKADATAGGTLTGNQVIGGNTTLGPKKIVGNMSVNGTLTIANTIYVTGDITLTGTVKLAASYGASSGIIIADGKIDIQNGVNFQDSGTAGSYILLLSNSTCDQGNGSSPCFGQDAITVGNNSNIIIANAQKGTVYFSNNASVKEAVGNKIRLKNNSTISYGTGVVNANFSSGPGGGYVMANVGEI